MKPQVVLKFWFYKKGYNEWFHHKSRKFDALIRRKFLRTYYAAAAGELSHWRKSPRGRLAEIIVLDQFSRNMFRGKREMYTADALALSLAQEVVALGQDKRLTKNERLFIYLPFEHSESKKIQKESVRLLSQIWDKKTMKYAYDHKRVIDKFGRFPHRNSILGRKNTNAEKKFLLTHTGW